MLFSVCCTRRALRVNQLRTESIVKALCALSKIVLTHYVHTLHLRLILRVERLGNLSLVELRLGDIVKSVYLERRPVLSQLR